jgi:hypothetical protein
MLARVADVAVLQGNVTEYAHLEVTDRQVGERAAGISS